ncbi:conserved hypothetical protein [Histoplasma capsulatum H143]|uniref:Uncharacterized protein n=1 Tax=Ajellomyces capsulatus (strain H143) TaxID=544712 RepID=C6H3V9_AJECH|nr:conserved hypothetical protein [Histoplasma capsulatum H143]
MSQFPNGNGMPFLWQTPQLFHATVEDDPVQLYPAHAMEAVGYMETPLTTHERPGSIISRPLPISQPSFNVDLKPPRFDVQWRWWEDEASFILRAFTVEAIKRLVQFRLYHDDNLPRSILRSRDSNTVTKFLSSLLPPDDGTIVTELTHYDRVEKLLSLCRSKDNEARPWTWFPTRHPNDLDYEAVARDVNEESYLQFKAVRFEDWVHYSLGYPTPSVEWFLVQHSKLSSYLVDHFNEFPDRSHKYVEVEKHLRSRSPFAHQAVLCSLKVKGIVDSDDTPLSTHRLMRFLTIPIQNLFTTQQNGLIRMLKKLVVLEIRFNHMYHQGSDLNWDSNFEAESPLLDEFFEASSPRALARCLTHSDDREFTGLSLQSFVTEDSKFRFPLNFFDLVDSANNYGSYRKLVQSRPGLPFLRPYVIEYQSHGERGLAGLFPLPDLS